MNLKQHYRLPLFLFTFLTVFNSCSENEPSNEKEHPLEKTIHLNNGLNKEPVHEIYFELQLDPKEYISWFKDRYHDIAKQKTIQDISYSVNYLPVEYMVCNELKKEKVSAQELEALQKEYEGMEYYELKIQALGHNDELAKYQLFSPQQYQERIKYMAFDMQKNIKLINDQNKESDCKLYHFERTYGITPHSTFLIGFSKEDIGITNERTIVINDQLFNKGLIKFNWTEQTLNNVPKLSVI